MKKIIFSTLIFLVLAIAAIVPYWTSLEVKRQIGDFNQTFYQRTDLKMRDSTYQRGWFHSVAESHFEVKDQIDDKSTRFILRHEIDHTFAPIQPTRVHTRIYPAKMNDEGAEMHDKVALLEVHTTVETNGDSLSRAKASPLKDSDEDFKNLVWLLWKKFSPDMTGYFPPEIPALHVKYDNSHLQWQGLQGTVAIKQNAGIFQTVITSPKIQLDTDKGKIVIQGLTFNADMQLVNASVLKARVNIAEIQLTDKQVPPVKSVIQDMTFNADMQSAQTKAMQGSLNIATVQLTGGKQVRAVKLEGIKLIGDNIVSEYLTVAMKTSLQQIQVGADRYGPGYGDFEIRHWHLPTLAKISLQDLAQVQQVNTAKFKLMSLGLTFLNNSPEFALTRLNLNTPNGELRGKLRIKMEPFEGGIFAFFNPFLLFNALNAELEAHIPQTLLDSFIQNNDVDKTIRQRLKTWKKQGILIPADDQPGYYRSQMQLLGGILQVNGQQLPLATIWNESL
jgi:hypothetical protein